MDNRSPTLLEKTREILRLKHYSLKTEEAYVHWIKQLIRFYKPRHPRELAGADVESFLAHLAVEEKVSTSTQNQALSALLFLYREVLKIDLTIRIEPRAKKNKTVLTVLTKAEANAVLSKCRGCAGCW